MCGIAGIFNKDKLSNISDKQKYICQSMVEMNVDRGPEESGIYSLNNSIFGHNRLIFQDPVGGRQPFINKKKSILISFNGEIYNFSEIKDRLKAVGVSLYTSSEVELLVEAYILWGENFVSKLNGQFSFALYDKDKNSLFLYRDHFGIHPLYFYENNQSVYFSSSIGAILKHVQVTQEYDFKGLEQMFTLWATIAPRTHYKYIKEVPPGSYYKFYSYKSQLIKYWDYEFSTKDVYQKPHEVLDNTHELLRKSVELRLKSDHVGAFLSGGLDSSLLNSMARREKSSLKSFSLKFLDSRFDESEFQNIMKEHSNLNLYTLCYSDLNLEENIKSALLKIERPINRSAFCPIYSLAKFTSMNSTKAILTGEGADEIFVGYNIFKEIKLRKFFERNKNSNFRKLLFKNLYPFLDQNNNKKNTFPFIFNKSSKYDLSHVESHQVRWLNNRRILRFIKPEYQEAFNFQENIVEEVNNILPVKYYNWDDISRAQYLEARLFLTGNLLSAQGDRVLMGNSIEGRYPFLDINLVNYVNSIPSHLKLSGLNEKYILKKIAKKYVPQKILVREKQPYRAPVVSLFGKKDNSEVMDILYSDDSIFDKSIIDFILKKKANRLTENDTIFLMNIFSFNFLHSNIC